MAEMSSVPDGPHARATTRTLLTAADWLLRDSYEEFPENTFGS